jgi:hypothetical protein
VKEKDRAGAADDLTRAQTLVIARPLVLASNSAVKIGDTQHALVRQE